MNNTPLNRGENQKKTKKSLFKRWWFWVIAAVLVIGIISLPGSEDENEDNYISPSPTSQADNTPETSDNDKNTIPENKDIAVEEQVLLNQNGVVITLKSLSTDSLMGPSLNLLIENNSDGNITAQIRNASVNGVMIENIFSCEVVAGKKANDKITFMSSELELAGIEIIKDIEFIFHIFDTESFETIFDSDIVKITTTADPSFVQSYDDSGLNVYDQNGFKIVVKYLDNKESFWGADIYLYIENNTDNNATIQIRDMSVNGFMIDPIFSCEIAAGKKAYDSITFLESDLEENNIEKIENLEFYFHIFKTDGWETIVDTDTINVSFE
jgi:hypothetical protein